MIEGQGLFNLAARSQAAARYHASSAPAIHLTSAMQADPKMKAFWEQASKKASETVTISADTLKRLDTARKSDNKDIAAEKYRQAKAKLQALRLQAQLAAATGDVKSLRRLAQEAAAAAREIANSVRGLADGIAATATAGASPNVPTATAGASDAQQNATPTDEGAEAAAKVHEAIQAAGKDNAPDPSKDPTAAFTGPVPEDADPKAWGQDALRKLGDDARSAIAQARGIIAFLANAARAARKHQADPEEEKYFNELQRSVSDAEHDVNAALGDASQAIQAGDGASGDTATADTAAGISATGSGADGLIGESTTLDISITTVAVQTTEVYASATFLV